MNTHAEVLSKAVAEAMPANNCSWCNPGCGDSKTSHGMCITHANQMIAEIMAEREKREAIEALPKPLSAAKESCDCRLCKSGNPNCSKFAGDAGYMQAVMATAY